jgi:N-acetylmuramoyl-L-alanine amidase
MKAGIVAVAITAFIGACFAVAAPSDSSTALTSASLERKGRAFELHFGFRGAAPRWALSAQGTELDIELYDTTTELTPRPLFGSEPEPIKTVRIIDSRSGQTHIAVEVEGKTDYAVARLKNEIVLRIAAGGTAPDIGAPIVVRNQSQTRTVTKIEPVAVQPEPAVKQVALASTPAPLPVLTPPVATAVTRPQIASVSNPEPAVKGSPLVMIDPGHGGYDPGTISASGIQEKDLALSISEKLRHAIEARGMRAAMTRSSDVFIPLPDRTKIANHAGADLFVSIHLNSSPNSSTTGIEVYYLNNTTDRATIRLARMENIGAPLTYGTTGGPNLNYILTDLRQQYKATEAASLAQTIDTQTVANLEAGMGLQVNALGAKTGPFYVLVGAHMPAVLVESGFLSNSREALHLNSADYQELLADGIATAISDYFNANLAVGNL